VVGRPTGSYPETGFAETSAGSGFDRATLPPRGPRAQNNFAMARQRSSIVDCAISRLVFTHDSAGGIYMTRLPRITCGLPTIRPESSHLPRTRTSHLCFSWHFRGPIRRGQTRDSTRVAVRPAPSTPKQNLCSCRRDVRGVFF
jgi:hypothetical protein